MREIGETEREREREKMRGKVRERHIIQKDSAAFSAILGKIYFFGVVPINIFIKSYK